MTESARPIDIIFRTESQTEHISTPIGRTTPDILQALQYNALSDLARDLYIADFPVTKQFNYLFNIVGKFWNNPICQNQSYSILCEFMELQNDLSAPARLCLLIHLESLLVHHCQSEPGDDTVVGIPTTSPRVHDPVMLYLEVTQRTIFDYLVGSLQLYTIRGLEFQHLLSPTLGRQPYGEGLYPYAIGYRALSVYDVGLAREILKADDFYGEPLYLLLPYDSDGSWYAVRWMKDGRVKLFHSHFPCHGFELPDISETFKLGEGVEGWREFMTPADCSCGRLGIVDE